MIAYNKLHILLLLSWQPRLKLKDGMRSIFPPIWGKRWDQKHEDDALKA